MPTGRWRRFPFYYTLLALSELDPKLSKTEVLYAAPLCERLLQRHSGRDKYSRRRKALLEKILAL